MSSITIKNCHPDICEVLRRDGVRVRGNKYLTAAYILDQAGVLDHLLMIYERSDDNSITGILNCVEKSIDVGRIISEDKPADKIKTASQSDTEPEKPSIAPKPLRFSS